MIGLIHEQERNDRDQWIDVRSNSINPGYHNNFNIKTNQITVADDPYEYGSIMHYGAYVRRVVPQ